MKSVVIDFDCNTRKWILCELNGWFTDIISTFESFADARVFCENNRFDWR